MKGLLAVNHFIDSAKFTDIYMMLLNAARREGIGLDMRTTGELMHEPGALGALPYDFVLFWDKDVVLAEMLENCGLPVFNSSAAIYACDNKAYTALRLQQHGIRTPRTVIAPLTFEGLGYSRLDFVEEAASLLRFPMIIKELYGSFSRQVYLAHDMDEARSIIAGIGHKGFLMQEFISSSFGRDLRINVVGDSAVSCMLRYSVNGDFRSNISIGGQAGCYDPTPAQTELAVSASRALGLDFAGVDVLFGPDDEPLICEVNSNCHFKSSLECTGVDMSTYIIRHIMEKMV